MLHGCFTHDPRFLSHVVVLLARCLRATAALIVVLGVCGAAAAVELYTFDLPSMALDDALRRYSTQTGRSVLFDAKQVEGRKSSSVNGRLSADAALQRLIAGTGMQSRFVSDDAFLLTLIPVQAAAPKSPSMSPRLRRFYGQMQQRITRVLCDDAALESGSYRLALRFRVSAAQKIEQLQVHATGRPDLEPRILARLEGLALGSAPPANAAAPITLLIQEDKGGRQGCAP